MSPGKLPGLCKFTRPFIWLKNQGVNERVSESVAWEVHENGLK